MESGNHQVYYVNNWKMEETQTYPIQNQKQEWYVLKSYSHHQSVTSIPSFNLQKAER